MGKAGISRYRSSIALFCHVTRTGYNNQGYLKIISQRLLTEIGLVEMEQIIVFRNIFRP